MEKTPLVSVVVITYNSSSFVKETLESIKRQTYPRIELIVTDDASIDNTVMVCKEWLCKNNSNFVNTSLIETEHNTGISGNNNRALKIIKGEWVKYIAGDDLLAENAIECYVNFCLQYSNVKVLFADYIKFYDSENGKRVFDKTRLTFCNAFFGDRITSKRQYNILLKKFVGSGPSFFVNTEILKKMGGFDERFPLQEDYALYVKLAKNGYKLYRIPQYLVYYRSTANSISRQGTEGQFYPNSYKRVVMDYKYLYRYENMNLLWKVLLRYSLFLNKLIFLTGNSKKSIICRFFYYVQRTLDPFRWYSLGLKIWDRII